MDVVVINAVFRSPYGSAIRTIFVISRSENEIAIFVVAYSIGVDTVNVCSLLNDSEPRDFKE